MAFDKAKAYLESRGFGDRVMEFPVSSATVELAAKAAGTEEDCIAKSLTFLVEEKPVMILCSGRSKINNPKYKALFHTKAKMLSPDQVREMIGHEIGGVCPFGVPDTVQVYLDESLKRHETVYPACGSGNSAVRLTPEELSALLPGALWADVCAPMEG